MNNEMLNEEKKLRNPLCIRWDDESHKRLTDAAWRRRISASELVRQLVADGLAELLADESAKGAENSGTGENRP